MLVVPPSVEPTPIRQLVRDGAAKAHPWLQLPPPVDQGAIRRFRILQDLRVGLTAIRQGSFVGIC